MKVKTIVVFEEKDFKIMREIIFDALGETDISNEDVYEYYYLLDNKLQLDVIKYGLDDMFDQIRGYISDYFV